MKSLLKVALCFLLLIVFSCGGGAKDSSSPEGGSGEREPASAEESVDEGTTDMNFEVMDVYRCPMDCEDGKEYDEEGACPVCGMELKHVDEVSHDDSHSHEDHEEEENDDDSETQNDLSNE